MLFEFSVLSQMARSAYCYRLTLILARKTQCGTSNDNGIARLYSMGRCKWMEWNVADKFDYYNIAYK